MSDLPPYVRDADQSPPPPPEAIAGQAGRPAVSPVQESALPLSGGGAPPPVVNFPPPVDDSAAGGDRAPLPVVNFPPPVDDSAAGGDQAAPAALPQPMVPPRQVQADAGPTPATPPKEAIPTDNITAKQGENAKPTPAQDQRLQQSEAYARARASGFQGNFQQFMAGGSPETTPGPGGTAVTTSPEPVKTTAAPAKPGPEDKLATTPGAAALPQPEVASAPYKGTIPMNGYNYLSNTQPEVFNTIASIGERLGVSTERLIQHARMESKLNLNTPDGKAGEVGPFQILPSTQKDLQDRYLGGRQIDARTWEGGALLAALKIRECDGLRGADSYASVACYNGGGDQAKAYAAKFFSDDKSSDYSKLNFGDLDKPNHGSTMTANGAIRAGQAGSDQFQKYIVDTSPRGMSMSDGWQHVQSLLTQYFILKGDMDGAEKAQDFVMRQAFMGSNIHLMGAAASLERGDGVTAAQQLAKAHAFFPDGTAGRFMTDGKNVFGVRLDETTGKPLGQPFKITAQDARAQLQVTGNPMTFTKFLSEQQKTASEIRLHNAQAGYQEVRPAIELEKEAGRRDRAAATIDQAERNQLYANMRKQAELDAKYSELKGAKDAETAKQVDQWANSDPMQSGWPIPPDIKTPEEQQAYMARRDALARGLKTTAPNMSIADSQVKLIADGIIKGTYGIMPTMNPKDPSQNGYIVVDPKTIDPKTKQPVPVPGNYYINTHAGEAATNTQHPARALMQQQYQQSQQQGAATRSAAPGGAPGATAPGTGGASLAPYAVDNARLGQPSSVEGVSGVMAEKIHTMVAAMPPEVRQRFAIISGYRDAQRQMQVNPSAPNSRHGAGTGPPGTGSAVDLRSDPVVLDWINRNGPSRFGLGFPLKHLPKEQNHMEMVDPQGRRLR